MKFLKLVILHDVFIARLSLYKERAFSFSFNVSAETPLTAALTPPEPSYIYMILSKSFQSKSKTIRRNNTGVYRF